MGNVSIRRARVDDAVAIARVHDDSWRAAHAGFIAPDALDRKDVAQRTRAWSERIAGTPGNGQPTQHVVVAEVDDSVAGCGSFGAGSDPGTRHLGELSALYVHPDFWSQGVGHELITHIEDALKASAWDAAYLWMLAGNTRAAAFWDRHDWTADGATKIGSESGPAGLRQVRHTRALR